MLNKIEKTKNKGDKMNNLIIATHKENYYIATAFLYKGLGKADIVFSRADKIYETLNEYADSSYKNIYIVAMRIKEDYIDEIRTAVDKMIRNKKEVKWFVLRDRVHITKDADKKFFANIIKTPDGNETLIDIMKKEPELKINNEDYDRLNEFYEFIDKRLLEAKENKKQYEKKLSDKEKEFEQNFRYIEYTKQYFFRNSFEGEKILIDMIKKVAYNSISADDLKNAVDFYEIHLSGESKAVKKILEKISKLAYHPKASVLIYGETGIGKEVVARMIHDVRKLSGRFMGINCAAIPETLMESNLFGYKKGSHSQADKDQKGIIEMAENGTVFLDEIGEMSMNLQAKLLRVLEEKEVLPVGSTEFIPVNFSIICATNRDLEKMVKEGKFRHDLFYRINTYEIIIPPLRERKEDIEIIAAEFLYNLYLSGECERKILTRKQLEALKSYNWPGNVRELQNFLYRAIIDEEDDFGKMMEEYKLKHMAGITESENDEIKPLEEIIKDTVLKAIKKCNGNKTQAAKMLGIATNTLKKYLK